MWVQDGGAGHFPSRVSAGRATSRGTLANGLSRLDGRKHFPSCKALCTFKAVLGCPPELLGRGTVSRPVRTGGVSPEAR